MTGDEKLRHVRRQIDKVRAGQSDSLKCPYCEGESLSNQLCCEAMGQAIAAILHRRFVDSLIDVRHQIEEMASRN